MGYTCKRFIKGIIISRFTTQALNWLKRHPDFCDQNENLLKQLVFTARAIPFK
jgi:hypothetical protein